MKSPRPQLPQSLVERAFVAALAVLCGILTVLQFYWTGALSQATREHLQNTLAEQAQFLCQAFDTGIAESCSRLLPSAAELKSSNPQTAHAEHFRRWREGKPRPIFNRLAVAIPQGQGAALQLYLLDQANAHLNAIPWPAEWNSLQQNLLERLAGGRPPPFKDPAGRLREMPVFGDAPPESVRYPEIEWLILELDQRYARETWLPELVRTYLNPGKEAFNDVSVTTLPPLNETVYATAEPARDGHEKSVSIKFNRQVRRRRGIVDDETFYWMLNAWPRAGALESAVAFARWRNLALACIPNFLMLAAGVAMVKYTRRTRLLAEAQMNFVANVSHELRTPITVIRGAGHNLLRGIVQDRKQIEQYLRLIIQHADQLGSTIEQVLEHADARKKSGDSSKHRPVEIPEVLDAAIGATLTETRAAGCEIQATILRGLPPVQGDAAALRRVFQNLLINAAKYGASGGWIGVETAYLNEGSKRWVEVCVSDRGPGIPKAEQATIFEPFSRGSSAQRDQIRGTGLGLSLVRETVQAHGGVVAVRSEPGSGTCFTVRLPAIENAKLKGDEKFLPGKRAAEKPA